MEKIKITPKQIIMELMPAINELKSTKKSAKVTYAFVKMSEKCQSMIKTYDKARIEVLEQHAKKTEDGKPEVKENNYVFDEEMKKKVEEEINTIAEMEHDLEVHSVTFDEISDIKIDDFTMEILIRHKMILDPGQRIEKPSR